MSQHDFNIANQGFPATRADLNNALAALASSSSGTSEPTTTYAGQMWNDTTNNLLKFRNDANDGWVTFAKLDQATNEWEIRSSVVQAVDSAGIAFKTDEGTTRATLGDDGNWVFDGNIEVTGTVTIGSPSVPNANILHNPSFTVQQRGDVIDHAVTTFGPDRWRVRGISGAGGTLSRSTTVLDSTTGTSKLQVAHTGATSAGYIYQSVEAVNIQGLYGSELTFSFYYSDSGSGDPKAFIRSYDSSATLKTLFNAVPTDLGGGRWSCTFTLSTSDGTFPDYSNTGLLVQIEANSGNTAPNQWNVWETKLEAGSEVTPFVARPYSEELALCQRYYYSTYTGTANKCDFFQTSPQYAWPNVNMPVAMRAKPTASISLFRTRYMASDDNSTKTRTIGVVSVKGGPCHPTSAGDFLMTALLVQCTGTTFSKYGGYCQIEGGFDAEL